MQVFDYVRGETIFVSLRSKPPYNGTETAACDIKPALRGFGVPNASVPPVATATPIFVPDEGSTDGAWIFVIASQVSALIPPGDYVARAKIVFEDGVVDHTDVLGLRFDEWVTE